MHNMYTSLQTPGDMISSPPRAGGRVAVLLLMVAMVLSGARAARDTVSAALEDNNVSQVRSECFMTRPLNQDPGGRRPEGGRRYIGPC